MVSMSVSTCQRDLVVRPAGGVAHHVPHFRGQFRGFFDRVFKSAGNLPDPGGDHLKADAFTDAPHRVVEVAGGCARVVKGFPVPVQAALVVCQLRFQARHCGLCPVQLRFPLLRLFAALAVLFLRVLQGTVQALHDGVLGFNLAFQCLCAGFHQLLRVAGLLKLRLRQCQLGAQVADACLRFVDRPLIRLLSVNGKRCFDLPCCHQLSSSSVKLGLVLFSDVVVVVVSPLDSVLLVIVGPPQHVQIEQKAGLQLFLFRQADPGN